MLLAFRLPIALLMLVASSSFAQTRPDREESDQEAKPSPPTISYAPLQRPGQTVDTGAGLVGNRQTREDALAQAGIRPMARIASRIQNRVQSRLRNRIDRNYDPQGNASDPFDAADEQVRIAGAPRR